MKVCTQKILEEDCGVLQEFCRGVLAQVRNGKSTGCVFISQLVYNKKDWLYALGGIQLDWTLKGNVISTSFKNIYRWHPQESRITQSIHQAAENLKAFGVKEYMILGSPAKIAWATMMESPFNKEVSTKRCYLL